MSLRDIPAGFDATAVAEIDRRLAAVCDEHEVAIGIAIESGSRAWGFPSPDSDYDCRFVFVRPPAQHVSPWPRRDVIETPLEGDMDVNGWELGKALKLLIKGNAVIIEWLMSPIVYRGEAWFRDDLLAFAHRRADRVEIARHYLHLGERQRRVYFADAASVPQKKIFYALRPAAVLRWLRLHPEASIAPMHFPTLMRECDPPPDVAALTSELLRRKALTRELGSEPLPPSIAGFIDAEYATAREEFERGGMRLADGAQRDAEEVFRNMTYRLCGGWQG